MAFDSSNLTECLRCGEPFVQSHYAKERHKFCSDHCRHRYGHEINKAPPEAICKGCNETFSRNFGQQKFCSNCRPNYNPQYRAPGPIKKECDVCGELFISTRGRKYCSKHCFDEGVKRNRRRRQFEIGQLRVLMTLDGFDCSTTKTAEKLKKERGYDAKRRLRDGMVPLHNTVKQCKKCGVDFSPKTGTQKYCKEHQPKNVKKPRKQKVCVECGTTFAGTPNQVVCSLQCRRTRINNTSKWRYHNVKYHGPYEKTDSTGGNEQ